MHAAIGSIVSLLMFGAGILITISLCIRMKAKSNRAASHPVLDNGGLNEMHDY